MALLYLAVDSNRFLALVTYIGVLLLEAGDTVWLIIMHHILGARQWISTAVAGKVIHVPVLGQFR